MSNARFYQYLLLTVFSGNTTLCSHFSLRERCIAVLGTGFSLSFNFTTVILAFAPCFFSGRFFVQQGSPRCRLLRKGNIFSVLNWLYSFGVDFFSSFMTTKTIVCINYHHRKLRARLLPFARTTETRQEVTAHMSSLTTPLAWEMAFSIGTDHTFDIDNTCSMAISCCRCSW